MSSSCGRDSDCLLIVVLKSGAKDPMQKNRCPKATITGQRISEMLRSKGEEGGNQEGFQE